MSLAGMVALFIIFILGFVFDASLNQPLDEFGNSTLGLENQADIDTLTSGGALTINEIGVGQVRVSIPFINPAFFLTVFRILTWDLSFFEGYLNIFRLLFFALTFAVTSLFIRDYGTVMVAIAQFAATGAASAVGGVTSVLRAVFRLF